MRSYHRRPYLLMLLIALVFSTSGANAYALTPISSDFMSMNRSVHVMPASAHSMSMDCANSQQSTQQHQHMNHAQMADDGASLSEHCKNTPHTLMNTAVGNHCQSGHCNDNMCGSVVGVLLSSTLVMFGTSTYLDVFYPLHSHQLTGYPRSLYRPPIA